VICGCGAEINRDIQTSSVCFIGRRCHRLNDTFRDRTVTAFGRPCATVSHPAFLRNWLRRRAADLSGSMSPPEWGPSAGALWEVHQLYSPARGGRAPFRRAGVCRAAVLRRGRVARVRNQWWIATGKSGAGRVAGTAVAAVRLLGGREKEVSELSGRVSPQKMGSYRFCPLSDGSDRTFSKSLRIGRMRRFRYSASDAPALPEEQLSNFSRRITIREGMVEAQTTLPKVCSPHNRFWIPSHFQPR
jgi:hypothetical protein